MNIEKEYIQKLLDSYLAAETTREEEDLLADYFCTHRDVPAEWRGYSILFRGIKQYKPMKIASHKSVVLKWSAAAAIITILFGTGLLLIHHDKTSINPSDSVAYTNEPYTQNVIEPKHETGMTESVQAELPVERSAQKHRVRKSKKEVIPSTPAEPLPDISQPVRSLIPADASTRSLSSHREQMRNNIEAIFEQNTIFIAQNSVEL